MPSKPTNLGLWATDGGTTVEPLLAQKQAGWHNATKAPARWMNWWMNNTYQWIQWVDAFESTAHTWTAVQTFAKGMNVTNDAGTLPLNVVALGASQKSASFLGGSGTAGGNGAEGAGGTGSTGDSGGGSKWTGGAIDGTVNHTGAGGRGVQAFGGAITSDADHRKGGIAVEATGGLGQDGYGAAFHGVHGNIELDDGAIIADNNGANPHVLGTTQIDGDLTVLADLDVVGTLTAKLFIEAPNGINALGYSNGWGDSTSGGTYNVGAYWKDAEGFVHLRGRISGGASGASAFTLPVGYRPSVAVFLPVITEGTSFSAGYLLIGTNGIVQPNYAASNGNVHLNCAHFRL